jgi:hypothetical protein
MNILITNVLSEIKKINFANNNRKDPELRASSVDNLTILLNSEKTTLLQTQTPENTKLILINALLERSKELQVRKITYKPLSKKDVYQTYLENIIGLHNKLATSIS